MENNVFWSSGLMAINPELLTEFKGRIKRSIFRRDKVHFPCLSLCVIREEDKLKREINFCYNPEFNDGLEENKTPSLGELMEPLIQIYNKFGVNYPSEMAGLNLIGIYFQPKLMHGELTHVFNRGSSGLEVAKIPYLDDRLVGIRVG